MPLTSRGCRACGVDGKARRKQAASCPRARSPAVGASTSGHGQRTLAVGLAALSLAPFPLHRLCINKESLVVIVPVLAPQQLREGGGGSRRRRGPFDPAETAEQGIGSDVVPGATGQAGVARHPRAPPPRPILRAGAAAEGGAHLRVQRRARHVGHAQQSQHQWQRQRRQGRQTTTQHRRQGLGGDAAGQERRRRRCLEPAGVLLLRALMSGPSTEQSRARGFRHRAVRFLSGRPCQVLSELYIQQHPSMILVHDDDFARLTGPAAADDDGFVAPYPSAAIAVL